MQPVLFSTLLLPIVLCASMAKAQLEYTECGKLEKGNCVLLNETSNRWNELFGENIKLVGFAYKGESTPESIDSLYSMNSESRALTVDPDSGELKVRTVGELATGLQDGSALELSLSQILRFRNNFTDVVAIEWEKNGERFFTYALVGPNYPYLLDTIIASVIIADPITHVEKDAILCDSYDFRWASYVLIGRYEARYYSTAKTTPFTDDELFCKAVVECYNSFGSVSCAKSETVYDNGICSTDVKVAFSGPLSSVVVKAGTLDVEVGGLGGNWSKGNTCVLPPLTK